jgi:hypothetical protein
VPSAGKHFGTYVKANAKKWWPIIKVAGIKGA